MLNSARDLPGPLKPGKVSSQEPSPSVIGQDLELLGTDIKIIVQGRLRIDGRVHADVFGSEIAIGTAARVSGTLVASAIEIEGTVAGCQIHADTVTLFAGSRVDADVHHLELIVEEGAVFEGRSKRRERDTPLPSPHEPGRTS